MMNSSRLMSSVNSARRGLSLVEVLIALALSGLLLTSVYSAISMYFLYSHSGQEEIAKNQLARVLLQRIEQDLRSVVYRPDDGSSKTEEPSSSTTAPTTTGASPTGGAGTAGTASGGTSTGTTTTEVEVTDPSEAFAGSASGLFGDAQSIVLHVSRPRLDMLSPQLSNQVVVSRTSDLKTVSFFVAGNGTNGLQAAAAAHFATQNPGGSGRATGLARMEGDRLALQLADKSGNVTSLLGQTQMLAPEVSRVGFRYYDGSLWTTKWDSASYGGLPRAVEITLEMTFEPKTKGQGLRKKTIHEKPRTYRMVVFLPLSKPMLTTGS